MSDIAGLRVDLPAETLEQIVELVTARVAARPPLEQPSGWLNAARAAEYLSVPRRRIYDLKSMGVLEPDGYDGRTPLWRRESLDAYAMSARP